MSGKCNREKLDHRGRFQAQGDGLEESEPWAQKSPIPKPDAHHLVDNLAESLSKSDFEKRRVAFTKCRRFIDQTPTVGMSPVKKSYSNDLQHRDIRVDIEIQAGLAFVG